MTSPVTSQALQPPSWREYLIPPHARTPRDYLTSGTPLHWMDTKRVEREKVYYQGERRQQIYVWAATWTLIDFPKFLIVNVLLSCTLSLCPWYKRPNLENLYLLKNYSARKLFIDSIVIAPTLEEIIHRYIVQNIITRYSDNPSIQIGVSHTFFSLMHPGTITRHFLFHGRLSTLYYQSDSLSAGILAHTLNNAIAIPFIIMIMRHRGKF